MHSTLFGMIAWWLLLMPGALWAEAEFLPPEQAFPLTLEVAGPNQVRAVWEVTEGYYLYGGKLGFATETPGFRLGEPQLPSGEITQDEYFGEVEILRGRVVAEIPLERDPSAGNTLEILVRSQGCADAGLCYPPQRQPFTLTLPPHPAASAAEVLGGFSRDLGLDEEDGLIPVEQAFIFDGEMLHAEALRLSWRIAPGTYLYQEQIELRLLQGDGVALGAYQLPAAKTHQNGVRPDGTLGDVAVYEEDFSFTLPLVHRIPGAKSIQLEVAYQGCADIGICYPPRKTQLNFSLPEPARLVTATTEVSTQPQPLASALVSEQDQIANALRGDNIWWILLTFFGFGALLSLTPCIFPMIPILSGIIAGQKGLTSSRSFVLSLVYVLAMALTYAAAGVLAALFGQNLQVLFQDPWILGSFVVVFIALALSMFGFYELQLPSVLQSKISEVSNRQQGGHLMGVAIMGFLSALIVGPCVAPPLAGALIYVGQTGDWVLGGLALFVLALGMGLPLLLIGASAGKLLPRAGAWMEAVKAVFGVGLLAVAIVLLERIVPAAVAMLLWGSLLVVSGVYMGALRQLPENSSGWWTLWKGLGLVLVIYGTLMLLGAAAGGKDTVQPLRGLGFSATGGGAPAHVAFKRIKSEADLEREIAAAAGRPVMLDFYADWCVSCKEMERYTFSDPGVIAALQNFVVLQADVTADDDQDRALLQGRFGLPGPPAIIFWGADGVERSPYRIVGFKDAKTFSAHLAEVVR